MNSSRQRQPEKLYFHCVDSRREGGGNWYARIHRGPFSPGLATTIATALRRERLTDLPFLTIQAVELEGAVHEFSRLAGIHEPVLEILLQFRDVAISFSNTAGRKVPSGQNHVGQVEDSWTGSFEARGPGVLCAGDLRLPPGRVCVDPERVLAHLAPGAVLRGKFFIHQGLNQGSPPFQGTKGNFLQVPSRLGPVRRVGFRIEDTGPLDTVGERAIFEILTDGTLSPAQALRQAAERLVRLFIGRIGVSLQEAPQTQELRWKTNSTPIGIVETSTPTRVETNVEVWSLALEGYKRRADPLGLDLGNLDLSFQTYQKLVRAGIKTVGTLVDRYPELDTSLQSDVATALARFGIAVLFGHNFDSGRASEARMGQNRLG